MHREARTSSYSGTEDYFSLEPACQLANSEIDRCAHLPPRNQSWAIGQIQMAICLICNAVVEKTTATPPPILSFTKSIASFQSSPSQLSCLPSVGLHGERSVRSRHP